jgi:hypothetical protein
VPKKIVWRALRIGSRLEKNAFLICLTSFRVSAAYYSVLFDPTGTHKPEWTDVVGLQGRWYHGVDICKSHTKPAHVYSFNLQNHTPQFTASPKGDSLSSTPRHLESNHTHPQPPYQLQPIQSSQPVDRLIDTTLKIEGFIVRRKLPQLAQMQIPPPLLHESHGLLEGLDSDTVSRFATTMSNFAPMIRRRQARDKREVTCRRPRPCFPHMSEMSRVSLQHRGETANMPTIDQCSVYMYSICPLSK